MVSQGLKVVSKGSLSGLAKLFIRLVLEGSETSPPKRDHLVLRPGPWGLRNESRMEKAAMVELAEKVAMVALAEKIRP